MYIQEITIEGFKSYAQRVTLPSWDPCFNAITGLNGSGKSNILDSICFVLGIKNLSQVRAQNLQELVYKQGQAGITKATVSITFRNDDPKTGPAGYEDKEVITVTRQIVIGGRNKYLINGHAAQENRVQDLFHSVQLNVNNPHFLIMQGRITKVLNMKPPEILSLLEEASGTRMYEKKKETAMKTLEKKQQKLAEIDQVLDVELRPNLETLRKQCGQYNEWASLTANRERLKRFCIAYDYVECAKNVEAADREVAGLEAQLRELSLQKDAVSAEIRDKESQIKDLQTEKEIQAGGEIKELQKEADGLLMALTKDTATWKNKKEALEGEQASLKQLGASLEELDEAEMAKKVDAATAARNEARSKLEAAEHSVEAAVRELAGAEAGDGRDESNKSLQERLADAANAQTAADADAKAADIRAKHLTKQLAEQRKALGAKEKEAGSAKAELAKASAAVEEIAARLAGLGFDEAKLSQLEAAQEAEAAAVRGAKEAVEAQSAQLSGLDFRYADPSPGFDRSKVKGVVAKLVRVADPATSLALEVAAGGKLYQVVVDDEVTGKALLERGRLTKRVTIIPLNKVKGGDVPAAVVDAARRLGGGKASPALQLIGYDEEVDAAMRYAFGGVFVCQDAGTAKKLAFSKEVGTRCITLDGDDFNPSGILTGGSRNLDASVLKGLHALVEAEGALAAHQAALAQAEAQLKAMAAARKDFAKLRGELELKQHSLKLLQERIAGGEAAQLAAAAAETEAALAEAQAGAQGAASRKSELAALAKDLERQIRDFSKDKDKRIKAAQDKLKKAKSEVEAAKKGLRLAEQALAAALAEQEAAGAERAQLEAQRKAVSSSIAGLSSEVDGLKGQMARAQAAYEAAALKLEARRARLKECDAEIGALEKERDGLARQLADVDVDAKRRERDAKAKAEDAKARQEYMRRLEKDYGWIATERAGFGTGDYDFAKFDPKKMRKEYNNCEERLKALTGRVNQKAAAMLEKAEEEFASLMDKRQIVENDRGRIEQVISELDEKKKKAIEATWLKVNGDFGSIFSTLLPGTMAKLEPPEGCGFLDGLEVRVAFGDVWKESLTELSGGQRSLLALSLILALCRFKPAPIYILDEVDAALDLNHTQNIGRMIKQHFPQSQFIVVSLKEGMFNNANVIFRTKFVDGVSAVARTVNEAARGRNAAAENENEHAAAGGAKGKGKAKADASQRAALRENMVA